MFSDFLVSSGYVIKYVICQTSYEARNFRHLTRGPFQTLRLKNSLRGDLNSKKVIAFCYVKSVVNKSAG